MSAFHVEGTGVYDGEVCYTDTINGSNMNEVLIDVRRNYEKEHGEKAGLVIEFRAWAVEE